MSAPTKTLDGLQPVVVNAVARASLHGVKVDFRFAVDSNTLEIVCFSGDKKVNAVIDLSEIEDHGQALIAVKINTILADHFIYDTAKNKALESELLSYKQAVHQLSFQLEMLKDKQATPAAPHRTVMTLVELCKQIKELPETKMAGVRRALDEMDIAFKEKR